MSELAQKQATTLTPTAAEAAELARTKIFAGIPDDEVKLALAIAGRYGLDPLLRHLVLIPGGKNRRYNVYITRDGLLHIAHTSGKPWSIEIDEPVKRENPYTGKQDIYLKGRVKVLDPTTGQTQVFEGGVWFSEYNAGQGSWKTHPAAMHQKVLEVYLLRRAFDVALTPIEEMDRVTQPAEPVPVEAQAIEPQKAEAVEPKPATPRQKGAIHTVLKELGFTEETASDARAFVAWAVGRENLSSLNELTAEEASRFLDATLTKVSGKTEVNREAANRLLEKWVDSKAQATKKVAKGLSKRISAEEVEGGPRWGEADWISRGEI